MLIDPNPCWRSTHDSGDVRYVQAVYDSQHDDLRLAGRDHRYDPVHPGQRILPLGEFFRRVGRDVPHPHLVVRQ